MARRWLFAAGCLGLITPACEKGGNCFRREGPVGDETRLQGRFFQNLSVNNHLHVYIVPHQENRVVVTAGAHLRNLIKTELPEGSDQLNLSNKNTCLWFGKYKATFRCTVYVPNLWYVRLANYGDVILLDTLRTPYFSTTCDLSAGDVRYLVNNDHFLWIQNSGVTNLHAAGRCGHFFLYLKDRGHVYCENLIARTAYVFTEGAGPVHLHVTDTLTLLLDGLGDVYVHGHPHVNLLSHTGKGKLIMVP
ncbi:MAG: DUF2807 domain-containing protein [Flavobacteriales bacterium]|nr:DUF2807 domain-containing protein [Flavobacteriales bacterium]MCX7769166.1 DUF2807 domain-containing protein [Flavobacteriales bacterium]MDW8410298.1 DUF2807 domain-containing protein [Flavobacteriales bacterium]